VIEFTVSPETVFMGLGSTIVCVGAPGSTKKTTPLENKRVHTPTGDRVRDEVASPKLTVKPGHRFVGVC
jgi:hypothetical protein